MKYVAPELGIFVVCRIRVGAQLANGEILASTSSLVARPEW